MALPFSFALRLVTSPAAGRAVVSPQGLIAAAIAAGLVCIAYITNDYLVRKEGAAALEAVIGAIISLFVNQAELDRRLKQKEKEGTKDKPSREPGDNPPPPPPPGPEDKKPTDECLATLNLKPGVNDRWRSQRSPIHGNLTVNEAAFRLDGGIQPPAGQDTTDKSREWVRAIGKPTDDAGHMIANRFGGKADFNSVAGNIFPQNLSFNRGTMRSLDAVAAEKHSQGCDVCVHIGLDYDTSADLRPSSATYLLMYRNPGNKSFYPAIPAKVPNP